METFALQMYGDIRFINSTDSTNRLMKSVVDYCNNMQTPVNELFSIYTNYQKTGRGLEENKWESEYGKNLLCSIYFRPGIAAKSQFAFNQCFALSAWKTLSQYTDNVTIKWPNDIYVDHRKLAGILIEHTIYGGKIKQTIAGIGINVNQVQFPDNLPNPVSIRQLIGKEVSVEKILYELLDNCSEYNGILKSGDFSRLQDEYLSKLYRNGIWSHYLVRHQPMEAKIIGTNEYGQLQLENRAGKIFVCNLKEIIFQ